MLRELDFNFYSPSLITVISFTCPAFFDLRSLYARYFADSKQAAKNYPTTPAAFSEPKHPLVLIADNEKLLRFRCHTGHAFSADSLLTTVTENIENSLYSAMRGVEESVMLLNHFGDHFAEVNQTKLAAMFFKKAKEAEARAQLVRQAVLSHERLSKDSLLQQAEETNGDEA